MSSTSTIRVLFWGSALFICALDLWSKGSVFERLGVDPGSYASIDEFHRDTYRHSRENIVGDRVRFVAMLNPGMMWGTFREYSSILKVLRVFAVFVILYLLRGLHPEQRVAPMALGAILGGAVGNIYDSFRFPGVRDFLEVDLDFPPFDPFPAFNVADSAICVGVTVLALGLLFGGASAKAQRGDSPPRQAGGTPVDRPTS